MPDGANPPPSGHNNPPPYRVDVVEAHEAKANEFLDAAGDWLDLKEITSEEQSGQLTDFLEGLRKRYKLTDEDRKADKKPHDDAGKAVQKAYTSILDKMKRAADKVKPMQAAWLAKVEAEKQAEAKRKAEEAAAAERAAAEAAAKAQARNDIAGEVEAEEAAKRAAQMKKDADRAAKSKAQSRSATGAGRTTSLRTKWIPEITNIRVACMTFADHPELRETLLRLAAAKARAADFDPKTQEIPGFTLHKEKVL